LDWLAAIRQQGAFEPAMREAILLSRDYRDIIAGGLLMAAGVWMALYAQGTLDLGSGRRMGPGMFPVAIGIILALFGIAIMIPAFFRQGTFEEIEIRSTLAVLSSIAAFAMVIRPYGLIPAIAALVVVATLAERTFRPVSILASIVVMATLAWLIFKAGLGLPLNMARWPH